MKIWVNWIVFVHSCRRFSEISNYKNIQIFDHTAFCFSLILLLDCKGILNGAAVSHDKQNQPGESKATKLPCCVALTGAQPSIIKIKLTEAIVRASAVPLHCVGKSAGWESVVFSVCVGKSWGGGDGVKVNNKNKSSSKHLQSSVRSIRSQHTNLDRQNNHNTAHETSNTTAWLHRYKTAAGPPSRCNIIQSTQWHFEPLPISFFHNDHNNRKFQGTGEHKCRRVDYISRKKLTALYLMPSLNRQALFVSVNLFSSPRQSASQCWRREHCLAPTGDNNSGTETFY